jgi:putative flippase GtrA
MNSFFNIRFIKFGLVGLSGMLIDFSITWLCKEKIKINKYVANSIGFICAASSNYYFNSLYTFHQTASPEASQFIKFISISIIGLLANNILLHFFVKQTGFNFYLLKIIVIGIVFLWNYFANMLFTFQ